tara:strand:- start:21 stop:179 length:159 start_codon:yes stop_codon:yes gene_type:complete
MDQFEKEIKRRIDHYYYQLAAYADAYNNNEMELKEYVVECEKVKEKIRLLER